MRIYLLPISTRRALIYCHKLAQKPASERGLSDKIIKRATDTWAKWETAEKGWQKKLTEYGNKGLKRISYEEWGLKSFPPLNSTVQAQELSENKKFEILFPGNVCGKDRCFQNSKSVGK